MISYWGKKFGYLYPNFVSLVIVFTILASVSTSACPTFYTFMSSSNTTIYFLCSWNFFSKALRFSHWILRSYLVLLAIFFIVTPFITLSGALVLQWIRYLLNYSNLCSKIDTNPNKFICWLLEGVRFNFSLVIWCLKE